MFQPTQNMDTAFRALRTCMLLVIGGCLLVCGYALYSNRQLAARVQDRVYVLANGKAAELIASTRQENIGVEVRDHVTRFHTCFFSLDPDEKAIHETIKRALYMADASAKKQYDDLVETGYIAGIISGNVSQQVFIDSVTCNTTREPYGFRCYGRLVITRSTSIVTRNLVTQGTLRSVARSDHNPHGFLIEHWEILDNKDLTIENR